jgi:hypothetical protein
VFWVMKINNTIRIKKPKVRDDHRLAARVYFTADSGGATLSWAGVLSGAGVVVSGG